MNRLFLIAPLLVVTLAACGGQTAQVGSARQAPAAAASAAPAPLAKAQPAARAAGAPAAVPNTTSFQGSALPPIPPVGRMIIKNGSLSLMVDDPEASLSQVDQLVRSERGNILSQTVRTQDEKTYVNLTIQVPPDNFEDTMGKLRGMRAQGTHVVNDSASGQDVTEQYTDLQAQYSNLAATRDAYHKLLDKATSVADIITLTREVANLQTQLDQIKGRENLLSRESAVSTINLTLAPVGGTPPGPKPLVQPAQAAQQAWQALLTGLQGLAVVLIWMGILLPIPALPLLAAWLIYRRVTRNTQTV